MDFCTLPRIAYLSVQFRCVFFVVFFLVALYHVLFENFRLHFFAYIFCLVFTVVASEVAVSSPAKEGASLAPGSPCTPQHLRHVRSVQVQTPSPNAQPLASSSPRITLLASFDKSILQVN